MAESVDCSEFCRLCLVKEQVNTPIFEEIGELQQLHVKITACLPIKVTYEDSLPKRICDDCIYKLDQQYQFWNTSVNAEKQLKQWLGICDEPPPKQETEKKVKKEKEQEAATTKRPRRNARRKAAQNVRQAAAAAIAASDSDVGLPGDDMDIEPPYTKEENDSDNDDLHDNTESLEDSSYMNVGLDSEEQAEAGPSGLQKGGTVASTNSGSDNGGAGLTEIKNEDIDELVVNSDNFLNNSKFKHQKKTSLNNETIGVNAEVSVKKDGKKVPRKNKSKYQKKEKKIREPHKCEICNKEFKRKYRLKEHNVIAHKITSGPTETFECEVCSKTFTLKRFLQTHRKRHLQLFSFFCEVCNKGFYDRQELRAHMNSNHGANEHQCPICKISVRTKYNLQKHLIVHKDVTNITYEQHKCKICEKVFDRKIYLSRHLKSHTGEAHVICDVCGKMLVTSKALEVHLRVHTGDKPFSCNICERRFRIRSALKLHLITHNKLTNTPDQQHKCSVCEKVFHHRKYLVRHEKIHTGVAKVNCTICGKELHSKTSLADHLNIHNGIKPHTCTICYRSFGKRYTLRVHQRTHRDINGLTIIPVVPQVEETILGQ